MVLNVLYSTVRFARLAGAVSTVSDRIQRVSIYQCNKGVHMHVHGFDHTHTLSKTFIFNGVRWVS